MDKNLLGNNLRKVRISKGLTIEQTADLLELTPRYWRGVEKGLRTPGLETLVLFCQKFSVSLESLLSETTTDFSDISNSNNIPVPLLELSPGEFVTLNTVLEVIHKSNHAKTGIITPSIMGNRLKKAREEQNLTLQELAKMVGMTWGSLQNIEKGKRVPPLKTLEKLTDCLKISPDYLLAGDLPSGKQILYAEFLDQFQKLTEPQQQIVKNFIDGYLKIPENNS